MDELEIWDIFYRCVCVPQLSNLMFLFKGRFQCIEIDDKNLEKNAGRGLRGEQEIQFEVASPRTKIIPKVQMNGNLRNFFAYKNWKIRFAPFNFKCTPTHTHTDNCVCVQHRQQSGKCCFTIKKKVHSKCATLLHILDSQIQESFSHTHTHST